MIIRKIVLVFMMLISLPMSVYAKKYYSLLVWSGALEKTEFYLNEHPVIIPNDGKIVIETKETIVEFEEDSISKFLLSENENSVSMVNEISSKAEIRQFDDVLQFSSYEAESPVFVYSINGKLLNQSKTDIDGNLQISLGGYPKGVYVVRTKSITYKIIKR